MDTIVTPVTVITLDSTRIVHNIKADLVARYFPPVVRLVQYDQSLPVIAVSLMQNGQTYTLPSGAAANIRVHKPDATYVYNPALGCDSTRNIVYFEVTQAMAAANGDGLAIVEIVVNGDIAGTSLITLHFEENPVPEDAIESSDEWETIFELGERIIASTVTPVSTAAGMTDHNVVYLYTGTESGWNQGHMYYYNGTTWVDAGIASTDKTLSVENMAADAKATGDAIATVKDGLYYGLDTLGLLEVNPNKWEIGHIYTNDGTNNPYFANRLRTKGYVSVSPNDTLKFTFTDGVTGVLYRYTDSAYLGYVALYNGTEYINDAQTTRLRFVLINTTTISKFDLLKHVAISSYYDQIGTIIKALSNVATNINVTDANVASYPDVNDFPNRSIINISASANISHKPFDSCTIITTGFNTTDTAPYGGSKQIAINNADGAIASRSYTGSAWTTWFNVTAWIPTVATLSSNVAVSSSNLSSYPNVDNFPNRSIIHILTSANVENKPFATCTVITTGFSTTGTAPYGGSKQIALSDTGSIASRSHNGTFWSAWTYSDHVYHATPSNYIEVIENALYVTDATVILESGTYNLFDSTHNEAYWKNKRPATRYCGINLKNGIKIVGDGLVNLDANYTGSDEDIKENFSVFNIAGSCEIRNVNIEGSNICYLVHDDPRIGSSQDNSCIIHGCKLIHNGTDHTFTSGAPMCIGAGESNNSYREYTDNVVDSTYDRSVNVHTATGGKGKYIISGNYFIKGTLGFTAFGDGTGRIEGIVSNNSLPSNVINRSNGASTPYTFNNVIRG